MSTNIHWSWLFIPISVSLFTSSSTPTFPNKHSTTSLSQKQKQEKTLQISAFFFQILCFRISGLSSLQRENTSYHRREQEEEKLKKTAANVTFFMLFSDSFYSLSTNTLGAIQNPQWEMNLHINYPILRWYDLFSLMINSWHCKFSHSPPHTHRHPKVLTFFKLVFLFFLFLIGR